MGNMVPDCVCTLTLELNLWFILIIYGVWTGKFTLDKSLICLFRFPYPIRFMSLPLKTCLGLQKRFHNKNFFTLVYSNTITRF